MHTRVLVLAAAILLSACAHMGGSAERVTTRSEPATQVRKADGAEREAALHAKVARLEAELDAQRRRPTPVSPVTPAQRPSPTPARTPVQTPAKPGECYAQVAIPPKFETRTERRLKAPAREQVRIIPAEYRWVEERVLIHPARERVVEVIPAKYRWVEERVMVKPATERIVEVPATYRWVEERVMVKPASQVWKPGRGAVEKLDNNTGEIMCLVEVPAEYKTIRRKVLETPASTRTEVVPAEYETIRRQQLVSESRVVTETVPAEYKTIRKQQIVTPARTVRTTIPAEYETVETTVKVADGRMEWTLVLCEVNATREVIAELQRALAREGYKPGKIDGILGQNTLRAVRNYQVDRGLAQGGVTLETARSLGLDI